MKPFYLSALFLACLQYSGSAHALLNTHPLSGQINNFPRHIDPIIQPVKKTIQSTKDQTQAQAQQPLDTASDKLVDPLLQLPKQLPIINTQGKTVLVDVEVEHGWRAVEREWLVMLEDKDLPSVQRLGVEILEQTHYAQLGMSLLRFKVTAELDSLAALQQHLPAAMSARIDRNHIYASQNKKTHDNLPTNLSRNAACDIPVALGIIDTAINLSHPAFTSSNQPSTIISHDFLVENMTAPNLPTLTAHGTAIAGLLVGKSDELQPLLPKATLYSASVFFARNDYAQGATMINLVSALDWLAGQKLSVINMSLAGPDNQILAKVIEKILASGHVIVAAAGNEGPAAPPLFPAAYPGVIAVTAVDSEHKIYRWANQGNYISFAALGVSVTTARSAGGVGNESGTSMAAPVVSALIACELTQTKNSPAQAIAHLVSKAVDLGKQGRDPVFGYGLL